MRHWNLILRSLSGAVLAFLMLAAPVRSAEPDREFTPAEMHAALKERDPVVDNYRIQFTRRETRRIDERAEFQKIQFNTFRFGGTPQQAPTSFPDPYDAVIVANVDMAAYGDKFMYRHQWLTDHHGHPHIPRHNLVVDDGDLVRELDQGTSDTTLTIFLNQKLNRAGGREQQMFYELALGVGFGRRIKTVNWVEKTASGWRLAGTFQLWTEDRTTFEMETDSDLFVRKATLTAIVHPRETVFEFTNSGRATGNIGPTFANTGSMQRIYSAHVPSNGSRIDAGKIGSRILGTVEQQYQVEVSQIDFDLTEDQYAKLSAIDAAQVDYVIDERPQN